MEHFDFTLGSTLGEGWAITRQIYIVLQLTFQYSDELSVGGDSDVRGRFPSIVLLRGVLLLQEALSCYSAATR